MRCTWIRLCLIATEWKTPMQPLQQPRLFYALWPNAQVAQALQHAQAAVQGGRLTHIQDFHLTLVFLGNQPSEVLPQLVDVLDDIPRPPEEIILDQYGSFGAHSVLWLGPSQPPASLLHLQSELVQGLRRRGVAFRDENRFRPHVTLGRQGQLAGEAQALPIRWSTPSLVLAESTGKPNGPRYRVLACSSATPGVL